MVSAGAKSFVVFIKIYQLTHITQVIFIMFQTTPIIESIEKAVKNIPGWTPIDQLHSLFLLAMSVSHLKGDILELGSWCGRSAIPLGFAANMAGNSKVVCVDLFPEKTDWYQNSDGTYSFSVLIDGKRISACTAPTVWKEPFERDISTVYAVEESLLAIFNQKIFAQGLEKYVVPFRGDLEYFFQSAGKDFQCKLAFIDGDHSYDSVCGDISRIEKHLVPGGWICFDDAFSSYVGIDRAIAEKIINNPRYEAAQQLTRKFFVAKFIG